MHVTSFQKFEVFLYSYLVWNLYDHLQNVCTIIVNNILNNYYFYQITKKKLGGQCEIIPKPPPFVNIIKSVCLIYKITKKNLTIINHLDYLLSCTVLFRSRWSCISFFYHFQTPVIFRFFRFSFVLFSRFVQDGM